MTEDSGGRIDVDLKTKLFATVAVLGVALSATAVLALDPRYKDENGDLVADTPKEASQLIDPSTLIFAYTPVEDPAVYAKI